MVYQLTATGHRLPYGVTQCYLHIQHKRTRPALTPAMQAGTRFTYYPKGMEGLG